MGEISRVFETTFGWTIYRVNGPVIEPDFSDETTLTDVRDYMYVFERGRIEDYVREQSNLFVATARETSFQEAASAIDQLPQQTAYFPINYGNLPYFGQVSAPSNETLASGAFQQQFFLDLFSLQEGEVSDPVVLRDYAFVFKLDDERESAPEESEFWEFYLPYVIQEFAADEVQRAIVDDDLLDDNFNAVYNEAVLGL